MSDVTGQETTSPRWSEERLRYTVLRSILDRSAAGGVASVTGTEVGAMLNLPYEDLFRVLVFLSERGYVAYLDSEPRVCITPQGVEYLEVSARRRRSIRD